MIFARKNARILPNNCPKNIFPHFRGGGARAPPALVSSYAYARNLRQVTAVPLVRRLARSPPPNAAGGRVLTNERTSPCHLCP